MAPALSATTDGISHTSIQSVASLRVTKTSSTMGLSRYTEKASQPATTAIATAACASRPAQGLK